MTKNTWNVQVKLKKYTSKHMVLVSKNVHFNKLDDKVNKYNDTYHSKYFISDLNDKETFYEK